MLKDRSGESRKCKRMFLKFHHLLLTIGVIFLLSACAHKPGNAPYFIEKGSLGQIVSAQPVDLINVQTTNEVKLCGAGIHSWNADLNSIADTAIEVMKDALEKSKVRIEKEGKKKLRLSIPQCGCNQGLASLTVTVTLQIETGSGMKKTFEGTQNGMVFTYQFDWALNSAIKDAVFKALKDPDINAYLRE